MDDTESNVLRQAIFALGETGGQDSLLLSLLNVPRFASFRKEILESLGQSRNDVTVSNLADLLTTLPDSLKATTIRAMSFIASKKFNNRQINLRLRTFLADSLPDVRAAAAYFFSRHPYSGAIHSLIRSRMEVASVAEKYRLKAISLSLEDYYIQRTDSALFDTLRQQIVSDLKKNTIPWQQKFYELSVLRHFDDAESNRLIKDFLSDTNPHLRKSAIQALSYSDSLDVKQALLKVYADASWLDKGEIVLALSAKYPRITYPLIQRNLDKGSQHFKQLLLKSLAVIRSRMAVNQLKQFLLVPDTRLKYTAFSELVELREIGYRDAAVLLESADLALTTVAAGWIAEHPHLARFEDLKNAYARFSEPDGVEAMQAIIEAMAGEGSSQSAGFLKTICDTSSSPVLVNSAKSGYSRITSKPLPHRQIAFNLFVPDTMYFSEPVAQAILITSRGEVTFSLHPEIAAATVSNFIYLAKKGFYNNLSFHRVVSDFVVQGGDPRGDGWGGPGYAIPCEYTSTPFKRGTVGMATAGKDTGGSQFFICHSEQPHLNGRYTVFAEVVSGMDIVDLLDIDDKILKIIIQN
ncbi:MAG: hypothetical protein E4H13_00770 [Calditrichales bacterium]|nr:MAG: hypothetical protein E4H13_00770 [Calditrichales bacterium]